MRQTTDFNAYGINYRVRHFGAEEAFAMFGTLDKIDPTEMLRLTEVKADDGTWHALGSPQNINRFVWDVIGELRPHEVLASIMSLVRQYNFGFKVHKINVPYRFRSQIAEGPETEGVHPVLAWVFTEGKATLIELQEVYNLEDVFKMYYEILKAKLNAARAAEKAQAEAKSKAR